MRKVIAPFVPAAIKRRHERWLSERFVRRVHDATREYVRRHGTVVRHGPFAGLAYVDELDDATGYLVAKLTGSYEAELHGVAADWIAAGFDHVVDVGCAEGYYAVGFARAMPATTVHAFDTDPAALELCAELARRNGVDDRVRLASHCDEAALTALPERGVALLADCEGCERSLLDPAAVPRLRGWDVLVELHEFIDPTIAEDLVARFRPTHEIELIEVAPRDPAAIAELDFLDPAARTLLTSERRPARMRWAVMRPRGEPA